MSVATWLLPPELLNMGHFLSSVTVCVLGSESV
jgi:hypothetical protein